MATMSAKLRFLPSEYAEPIRSSLAQKLAPLIKDSQETERRIKEVVQLARHICEGCRRKESVTIPPQSGVVGSMAVHSSGLICIAETLEPKKQMAPDGDVAGKAREEAVRKMRKPKSSRSS